MYWYIGTVIGTLFLTLLNYYQRIIPFNIVKSLYFLPILYCANLGYWYGYSNSPKFLSVWFLGTSLASIAGLFLSVCFFDKQLTLSNIIGVVIIVFGTYLLIK
jgi:hypothetical protein